MKIKIIRDSNMKESNSCSNLIKGTVLNVEDSMAKELVDKNIAEYVIV